MDNITKELELMILDLWIKETRETGEYPEFIIKDIIDNQLKDNDRFPSFPNTKKDNNTIHNLDDFIRNNGNCSE